MRLRSSRYTHESTFLTRFLWLPKSKAMYPAEFLVHFCFLLPKILRSNQFQRQALSNWIFFAHTCLYYDQGNHDRSKITDKKSGHDTQKVVVHIKKYRQNTANTVRYKFSSTFFLFSSNFSFIFSLTLSVSLSFHRLFFRTIA